MCGAPSGAAADYCASCFKKLEERYAPRAEEAPPPRRNWAPALWVLTAGCLAAAAFRFPLAAASFAPLKPFRSGAADTDWTADRCLRRLWKASRLMQEGRWPAEEMTCPAAGRPYVTQAR